MGNEGKDPAPLGLKQRRRHEVTSYKAAFVVNLISQSTVGVLRIGFNWFIGPDSVSDLVHSGVPT